MAIAILCGPDGKKFPRRYEYSILNTHVQYDYHSICLSDFTDEELEKSSNPFAWILRVARDAVIRGANLDERLLKGKLFIFRKLFENGNFERRKLEAILAFLKNYVQFQSLKFDRSFEKEINFITNKNKTMDIFELMAEEDRKRGFRQGVRRVNEKTIRNLLTNTRFSVEKIASLVGVSVTTVQRLSKKVRKR